MGFYEPHEKTIYSPEGSDLRFDPLSLDRKLRVASGGRLNALVAEWKAGSDNSGDIGPGAAERADAMSAAAELKLAEVTRQAFGLHPETLNGVALEYLIDFLGWMEGKGQRGVTPHQSPTGSPAV